MLSIIKLYKKFISSFFSSFPLVFPVACKFYPTCSEYSQEVFQKYGSKKGFLLSLKRFFRCNPFNKGGLDMP